MQQHLAFEHVRCNASASAQSRALNLRCLQPPPAELLRRPWAAARLHPAGRKQHTAAPAFFKSLIQRGREEEPAQAEAAASFEASLLDKPPAASPPQTAPPAPLLSGSGGAHVCVRMHQSLHPVPHHAMASVFQAFDHLREVSCVCRGNFLLLAAGESSPARRPGHSCAQDEPCHGIRGQQASKHSEFMCTPLLQGVIKYLAEKYDLTDPRLAFLGASAGSLVVTLAACGVPAGQWLFQRVALRPGLLEISDWPGQLQQAQPGPAP